MNASKINYAELLFLPIVLLVDAILGLLPFFGAVLTVVATWVAILIAILVFNSLIDLQAAQPRLNPNVMVEVFS